MRIKIAELPALKYTPQNTSLQNLIEKHSGFSYDYNKRQKAQSLEYVNNSFGDSSHFHSNYMGYLETAWANHYGVVMTPDILWHTLLSELVLVVGEDPKRFATLFTNKPDEKQHISIGYDDPTIMPLDRLADEIKKLVPTDSELFLPEFSTSSKSARFARYAAFADLVSPYYSYSIYCCGIPYVDVRGTPEDYVKIVDNWKKIDALIDVHNEYFANVSSLLERLLNNLESPEFWKDMFYLKRCGSGSQNEVFGWFTSFYRNAPAKIRLSVNFSTHLSKVCYENLSTKRNYEMYSGVVQSKLHDDLLEPDFGFMVYERLKEPKVTKI